MNTPAAGRPSGSKQTPDIEAVVMSIATSFASACSSLTFAE
jgi:hypothetical protein